MGKSARVRFAFFSFSILIAFLFTPAAVLAGPVTGTVTDSTGGALPQAFVRLIDASGTVKTSTIADNSGRFSVDVTGCGGCTIDASLTGFRTASIKVGATDATSPAFHPSLKLDVAPISDAIVVTPTRDAAPSERVGANVTVFTADDIARRGTVMLGDLLRETPGVAVIQNGGSGGITSLFMRGGESTYTKVLLDGIPLNEPGGTFNFANYTTNNIARVEVVRGAQSALFGSDAVAGVVQLVTARGSAGAHPAVNASFETGTYNTQRATGSVSGAAQGWDYSLGIANGRTDNRASNDHFGSNTFSWSAGRALSTNVDLRTTGRVESGKAGTPGQTAFGRADSDAFYEHLDAAGGISLDQRISSAWKQHVSYAFTRSRQDSTNLFADPSYVPTFGTSQAPFAFSDFTYNSENVLRRHVLNYESTWTIGTVTRQIITAAVDYDGERGDLTDVLAKSTVTASRNNIGVTLQHQLVGRRGSLVTSARAEHNDSFGDKFVPRISAALAIHGGSGAFGTTMLKANAGRGVKEPTILQSFSPNPYYKGNPDLRPETSRTVDLGISQRLANDRARVEVVYFDNKYNDIVNTVTTNLSTFEAQYFNIGNTKARGVELSGEAVVVPGLRISSGYTLVNSTVIDSTSPSNAVLKVGNWTFRRPRHSGFVRASLTQGRFAADLSGQYVGIRVDGDFSSLSPAILSSGKYWLWNASASLKLQRNIELFGRLENIGNVDYMEPLGYQAWQRTVHVGIRVGY